MRKITFVLLLMVCVATVALAEVGKFQLVAGRYQQNTIGKGYSKMKESFSEGIFKIDTETGDVWQYNQLYVVGKDSSITVVSNWKYLSEGTLKVDKDGRTIE